MLFTKNHSSESANDTLLHPTVRFVEDFTRLVTDVDRLMGDMRTVAERENMFGHENGSRKRTNGHLSAASVREHARGFVASLSNVDRFYEQIPLPYLELDSDGRILRSNNECVRLLNSDTPLAGRSLFGFLASIDIQRLRDHLAAVRRTNKPQHVHLSIAHKGTFRPFGLWTRRQLLEGQVRYAAVIEPFRELRDVSDSFHLRHEDTPAALYDLMVNMSNAHTLKSVVDTFVNYCRQRFSSPAGMVFVERAGDLELISQWHSARFSKKALAKEMIRNGPVARAFRARAPIVWPRERTPSSNVTRYLQRLLNRSRCASVVFLPIGSLPRRPFGVLAMVLSNAANSTPSMLDHVRHLGRTISGSIERARAYEEVLAARIEAERDITKREEFLSVLSHELKNPMVPILGWAVALGSGTLNADKQNVAIDGIVRNVRSLNYLIDDFFDASRISAGKLRLARVQMRIQDVAREALTTVQPSAAKKKLRISTDISEAIPPFFADPARLRQVLVNLLNNAVKFTPDGGMIALKILKRRNSVEFAVTDTGKGIAPKFLPFVFDRYQQDYRSSKPKESGLGLGLTIVRELVGLHGGSIKAYSEGADKGAAFVVRIPMPTRHR
jgi:signal transduction histidine kinase/PAS domain-containing protein